MMYDSEKYGVEASRMWLRVGRILRTQAESMAKNGHAKEAVKTANLAASCMWQATGEGDFYRLDQVINMEVKV